MFKKIAFQTSSHLALQDLGNCQFFRHPIFRCSKKLPSSPVATLLCRIQATVNFSDTPFFTSLLPFLFHLTKPISPKPNNRRDIGLLKMGIIHKPVKLSEEYAHKKSAFHNSIEQDLCQVFRFGKKKGVSIGSIFPRIHTVFFQQVIERLASDVEFRSGVGNVTIVTRQGFYDVFLLQLISGFLQI